RSPTAWRPNLCFVQRFKGGDPVRRAVLAAAMAAFLGASGPVLASGIPVFDATRAADFIQQFARMKEQLDTARQQLAEAQRLFDSMSGIRGFGDLFRNT